MLLRRPSPSPCSWLTGRARSVKDSSCSVGCLRRDLGEPHCAARTSSPEPWAQWPEGSPALFRSEIWVSDGGLTWEMGVFLSQRLHRNQTGNSQPSDGTGPRMTGNGWGQSCLRPSRCGPLGQSPLAPGKEEWGLSPHWSFFWVII